MPDRSSYEPVLSSRAAAYLVALSKSRQKRLINLLATLAENPNQVGDYSLPDNTGRDIQFILIRDQLIAFWPDHAVKELRILDIEEA